jgi:Fe2+ or Zn2+ uptake regulation protein
LLHIRIILDSDADDGTLLAVKRPFEVSDLLAARGIRLTRQREEIFGILLTERDHPTAADVYGRAKQHMPTISLATVYNCLEALVRTGLVKQVNLDRAPTRFCPNVQDHGHFFCQTCGAVYDVEVPAPVDWALSAGFVVSHADIALKGWCPQCSHLPI